jgi:hypothetical protein
MGDFLGGGRRHADDSRLGRRVIGLAASPTLSDNEEMLTIAPLCFSRVIAADLRVRSRFPPSRGR